MEQSVVTEKIQHLIEAKHFDEALDLTKKALQESAADDFLWYLQAVCQRYLSRPLEAQASLQELLRRQPEFGRAYQELGHIYMQQGSSELAVNAYQQAVRRNSALPASWRGLALALRQLGEEKRANDAKSQFLHLTKQIPELVSIASMRNEGRLYKAEKRCREFLQKHPHHPEAMRLLALIGLDLGILDDADFLLESCVALYPDFDQARIDYVNVLQKRQQFVRALSEAEVLLQRQPDNPSALVVSANALVASGELKQGLVTFNKVLEKHPYMPGVHLAKGHAYKTSGDVDAAIESYRAAYNAQPDYGDAFWSLANLKTYHFSEPEIAQMSEQVDSETVNTSDQYHLCFALGKALEDRQQYQESFRYYSRGNRLKRGQLSYSQIRNREENELQMQNCDSDLFDSSCGCQSDAPIFIVGLPRAGSTLLEQILSSHSMVEGTLELPDIPAMAHQLNGRRGQDEPPKYPALLNDLSKQKRLELGQKYLETTRLHRSDKPYFIDKMPNNFRHIGLIKAILPHAKIIDARRHPMACCFGGYKQLFADGHHFSYSLDDIANYYRDYVALMQHWDNVLPGHIHRVYYEQLVEDLEVNVRALLDYCQLPFEAQCLQFYKTERSIRTASAEQVRQPIYKSGLNQWQNYDPFLSELAEPLASVIDEYPL